jgi:hypothetical protein
MVVARAVWRFWWLLVPATLAVAAVLLVLGFALALGRESCTGDCASDRQIGVLIIAGYACGLLATGFLLTGVARAIVALQRALDPGDDA